MPAGRDGSHPAVQFQARRLSTPVPPRGLSIECLPIPAIRSRAGRFHWRRFPSGRDTPPDTRAATAAGLEEADILAPGLPDAMVPRLGGSGKGDAIELRRHACLQRDGVGFAAPPAIHHHHFRGHALPPSDSRVRVRSFGSSPAMTTTLTKGSGSDIEAPAGQREMAVLLGTGSTHGRAHNGSL